jgi:hypothetical protein
MSILCTLTTKRAALNVDHFPEKNMNKASEKRGIRSGNRTGAGYPDNHSLGPSTRFKDENIQPMEINISRLAEYIRQKEQGRNDGYWSVLGEL